MGKKKTKENVEDNSKLNNSSDCEDTTRSKILKFGEKLDLRNITASSSKDKEYDDYLKIKYVKNIKYVRVVEAEKDLFSVDPEYALAHCVAEDMKMGSGIAVQFVQIFKCRSELEAQRKKQGDVAILPIPIENTNETRYIYYMVTKRVSEGKPTYETLWSSIYEMRKHIRQENVKKLAIPRIGCGLDRLEWDYVKVMLEFAFRDVVIEILVCNFQQNHGKTKKTLLTKKVPTETVKKGKTPKKKNKR